VVRHYLADQPIVEIAESMSVSAGTVKSWLHRARAALAAQLGPEDTTAQLGSDDPATRRGPDDTATRRGADYTAVQFGSDGTATEVAR
jgi:hypothetical protein